MRFFSMHSIGTVLVRFNEHTFTPQFFGSVEDYKLTWFTYINKVDLKLYGLGA